ncbi:MAG: transposase [Bacteroidales bacterium]|nr:transposase [Bacteroidales bacterium]
MHHKQGEDRNQMFMFSLESAIANDSFVRVVDAFVDAIDLKSFGFAHVECQEEGRPPYHPSILLKLYLYGYRYGIRTTRKLERETHTNIEAMWLLSGLRPKYKTIADFRKNHSKAFREVFRRFVCLLREWNLVEDETVAIDSFKIRGSNSIKNNFNEAKLKRHLDYIDKQIKEYDTGDVNDTHALAPLAIQTKKILQVNEMTVLADKGYHTGEQLKKCLANNITTYVSPKAPAVKDTGLYPVSNFIYDHRNNQYICPQGSIMSTNGRWHNHSDKRRTKKSAYQFRRYTTPDCRGCRSRQMCTKSKTNGRYIDRSEFAGVVEANAKRVRDNPEYYRKRQQVTEHMFGTLKRQRGFTYALVRKKENVLGEVGLMFIGYNLGRCITIWGAEKLIKLLREYCLHITGRYQGLFLKLFKDIKPAVLKSIIFQKVDVLSVKTIHLWLQLVYLIVKQSFYTDSCCR